MILNGLVKLVFDTTFVKTGRSRSNIEIFQVCLNIFMVLDINFLLQAQVVLNHFFFVKGWLLHAQVVHDKEVPCLRFVYADSIDVIEIRALTMDDIAKMIVMVKNVITRVDKYLNLISYSNF